MYKKIKLAVARTPLAKLRIPVLAKGCELGMRALMLTWKMHAQRDADAEKLLSSGEPVIFAVYHGRMAALLDLEQKEKTSVLISNSHDGEMVAQALLALNFKVSRGSPKHGALQAAKSMLQALNKGLNVVVTVDGPRGPAMEVKSAVIRLAQTTGRPIIPLVMDGKKKITFNSWDRFMYPHMFSTVWTIYGKPLIVPKDKLEETTEKYEKVLQKQMDDIVRSAEMLVKNSS